MVSLLGNMVMAGAFLFFGPAPFFEIPATTSLIQIMIGLGGVGYALVMVSTFTRAQNAALEQGYSDNIETYLMISGMTKMILTTNRVIILYMKFTEQLIQVNTL